MKEIVEKALREKQNIAVYSNSDDTTKFAYGRPLCMDDVDFALYLISPNGEYDGILVQEINEILYIERDEQYAQKCKRCVLNTGSRKSVSRPKRKASKQISCCTPRKTKKWSRWKCNTAV